MKRVATSSSYTSYIVGFMASLVLTLAAYVTVTEQLASTPVMIGTVVVLAVTQLVVQLVCFLHLGRERSPQQNLLAFIFMIGVVVILVVGTLWIMQNLNHYTHSDREIIEDEGIRRKYE